MSTLKVDGIRSNSASSDAITLASDGTCTANITNKSNRNLIINGAMQVAQRGTSSTSTGIQTVDRFGMTASGTDETPTQQQVDVSAPSSPYHLPTSGAHPYKEGFRKAYGLTNGNQTSGAGTTDRVNIYYNVEAQDIANSGWDYTDPNSYITLSYWIKSSVGQNFYHRIYSYDGTAQGYCWETGTLTAFTWTKITKKIPGNANLTFDNNTEAGLYIVFAAYSGTNYTNDKSLDSWAAFASDNRFPNQTSTWYTTNDASFQITGVQLEVDNTGSGVATDFEHRSYGQELFLCQRYYQVVMSEDPLQRCGGLGGTPYANGERLYCPHIFTQEMRAKPTVASSGSGTFRSRLGDNVSFDGFSGTNDHNQRSATFMTDSGHSNGNVGEYHWIETSDNAFLTLSAEL